MIASLNTLLSGDIQADIVDPAPLLVISFEGLATSALSCYGSSWNATPTIDRIASAGAVWDRMISTSDEPLRVLERWLLNDSGEHWLEPFRKLGAVEFLTDDPHSTNAGLGEQFDRVHFVDTDSDIPSAEDSGAEVDVAETQFARLVAAAVDRHQQPEPWGVLWLHSRVLTHRWDAPRSLFPLDEAEVSAEPEEFEASYDFGSIEEEPDSIPPIFETASPPEVELGEDPHPDAVTSWMRTYGCQVRCIDLLLRLLLDSLERVDPTVILLGTSGYSLGQNGWVGHRVGPLRSCHVRLPAILAAGPPVRSRRVTSSERLPQILKQLGTDKESTPVPPADWVAEDGEFEPAVVTRSSGQCTAVTTQRWFYAREQSLGLEAGEALFLKPDDPEDANDISRREEATLQQLRLLAEQRPAESIDADQPGGSR